jgi:hypothetical protein
MKWIYYCHHMSRSWANQRDLVPVTSLLVPNGTEWLQNFPSSRPMMETDWLHETLCLHTFRKMDNVQNDIVTYRPVSKKWLFKKLPFLWNARSLRACAVTSRNSRRGDAGGVLSKSAPRLYKQYRTESNENENGELVSAVQLRLQLCSVNQRTREVEESPLLNFVTRKRLVKTLQRNSHCGELLPSKGYWK